MMSSDEIAINLGRDTDFTILMTRVQAGDSAAYHRLLEEVAHRLRCSGCLENDQHDAELVLRDILLTVHALRQTYDPSRPFELWLTNIASDRAKHCRATTKAQNSDAHAMADVRNDREPDDLFGSGSSPATACASKTTAPRIYRKDYGVAIRIIGYVWTHLNKFSTDLTRNFLEARRRLTSGSQPDRTEAIRTHASGERVHDLRLEYGPTSARWRSRRPSPEPSSIGEAYG